MPFDNTDYKPATTNPVVQILEDALAFLEEGPHRWTKGVLGRDEMGCSIDPSLVGTSLQEAHSVCSIGAARKAGGWAVATVAGLSPPS